MPELRLRVGDMGCRRCVREVTSLLRDVPGVRLVTADLDAGTVTVAGEMAVAGVLMAFKGSSFHPQLMDELPDGTSLTAPH